MNSRERILNTLEHREPDRVPYDLAGMHCTSIHVKAYRALCAYLGIDPEPIRFLDVIQQVVVPKRELLEVLRVDTRGLYPLCSHNWRIDGRDVGDCYEHTDEWGFTHRFPKCDGLWWWQTGSPLSGACVSAEAIQSHQWPQADLPERIAGLRTLARQYRADGKVVMLKGLCAGLFEMGQRIRGMENFLCDLLTDRANAELLLDRILEAKKRFWAMALADLGDLVDIVVEVDDYGTQESQLISYPMFREVIAPRLRDLIQFVKSTLARKKPHERGYVFFHSCGNIRPFLPDFIDMGIDIINPVHINAAEMGPARLKEDFGRDITFWGGSVDAQSILPCESPERVKEAVRSNLAALMPGGGYVFTSIHNIQADVPPANIMAMWEALQEYGRY